MRIKTQGTAGPPDVARQEGPVVVVAGGAEPELREDCFK
jgi:hypothetical protein